MSQQSTALQRLMVLQPVRIHIQRSRRPPGRHRLLAYESVPMATTRILTGSLLIPLLLDPEVLLLERRQVPGRSSDHIQGGAEGGDICHEDRGRLRSTPRGPG